MSEKQDISYKRWEYIKKIWNEFKVHYYIMGSILAIMLLVLLGVWAFGYNRISLSNDLLSYTTNLFTEAIGVIVSTVVTIVVVDQLNSRRLDENRKNELLFQLGSSENSVSQQALVLLHYKGWIKDGSLKGIDLKGANLSNANLEDCDLSNISLVGANLSNANLSNANLSGANFTDANLSGARFKHATLNNVKWDNADLSYAQLELTDLAKCNLSNANLSNANLHRTNLSGADLSQANLDKASLSHANLDRANLSHANLKESSLQYADLSGASLWRADLTGADLLSSNLQGADCDGTNLTGTYIEEANLTGAILTYAKISETKFTRTTLPDGTIWDLDFQIEKFTNTGHSKYIFTLAKINFIRFQQKVWLLTEQQSGKVPFLENGEVKFISQEHEF